MGKITNWLNSIWPKFQTAADKIQAWDLSPKQKELVNQIWLNMPIALQNVFWSLLKKLAEMYGDEFAKKILQDVLDALKGVGND